MSSKVGTCDVLAVLESAVIAGGEVVVTALRSVWAAELARSRWLATVRYHGEECVVTITAAGRLFLDEVYGEGWMLAIRDAKC